MTEAELNELKEISLSKGWETRKLLQAYLKDKKPSEGENGTNKRTSAQNNAIHLWFQQIADECQRNGVTMNLIIKHTHDVMITPMGVKGLWHVLQKALFDTNSTTQLKKQGEIDKMVDHFVALFAKEGIELPPFPHEDKNVMLQAVKNLKNENYPMYNEGKHKPTI